MPVYNKDKIIYGLVTVTNILLTRRNVNQMVAPGNI